MSLDCVLCRGREKRDSVSGRCEAGTSEELSHSEGSRDTNSVPILMHKVNQLKKVSSDISLYETVIRKINDYNMKGT